MKRIFSLLLVLVMAASLLYGCAKTEDSTAESVTENVADSAIDDMEVADSETEDSEITLDDIAKLNRCNADELNILFSEEGYLTFLGNRISDEKITDEKEAEALLQKMSNLLGLDGIGITYSETHSSPITGNKYYTFNQMALGSVAGYEDVSIEFFSSTLKLGVDENGFANMISSNLNHNELIESDAKTITAEQANESVREKYPDANIFPDHTAITYWDDRSSESVNNGSKLSLTWIVYADDEDDGVEVVGTGATDADDDTEISCTGYDAYIVSAIDNGDGRGQILAIIDAPEMDAYTNLTEPINTTNIFFDDMEDAGTYTYTVNFNWMSDEGKAYSIEYQGDDKLEVTVSVMRSKKDGLYYLGNKEHHIYMSNYIDIVLSEGDVKKFNPYVTENPEEINSWHFKKDTYKPTGQKYFDDPNYVIASFATYEKTVNRFGNKFDIFNLYPNDSYLLGTYTTNTMTEYPDNKSDFRENAGNLGQNYDWIIFSTSPTESLCLDDNTMAHEFTHGVNMHFANARYLNEPGAMMESYADVIGSYIVAVTENKENTFRVGGTYGHVLRNLSNPPEYNQPRYKNGLYYVSSVDSQISDISYNDRGGVHINSGVPNYLGYLMTKGKVDNEDEEQLTNEETLNLWYETLYPGNYDTDFIDQGAYFKYAAEQIGIEKNKINYMNRLLYELGFIDGDDKCNLLDAESTKNLTITLSYDSDESRDRLKLCVILCNIDDDFYNTGLLIDTQVLGGFADSLTQHFKDDATRNLDSMMLCAFDENGLPYTSIFKFDNNFPEVTFNLSRKELNEGESLVLDEKEELMNIIRRKDIIINKANGKTEISAPSGTTLLVTTQKDGAPEGEYNVCDVKFN